MRVTWRAQDDLSLFKADIDSAYRRVPLLPGSACLSFAGVLTGVGMC